MIARWNFEARFGYKSEAIELIKEWNQQIGSQTDIDISSVRIITGSVGAKESVLQMEFPIANLADLDSFFSKIASVKMHSEWGKKMGEVIVSGSTYWETFRVVG